MPLVRGWGGVTIAYRKRMVDSPAYRLNHEEVIKALEEGIVFAENLNPIEAVPDANGALQRGDLQARRAGRAGEGSGQDTVTLPARTMLRGGGDVAEHHLRERSDGHVPARREEEVLPAAQGRRAATARFELVPDPDGFFTSHNSGRQVRHLLRRQPSALRRQRRQGDGVGEARVSARDAAVRARARVARSGGGRPSATRRGGA